MSRHITFLSIPSHGHVIPTVGVVRELVQRGHMVTYVVPEDLAHLPREAGAEVITYDSPTGTNPPELPYTPDVLHRLTERAFAEGAAVMRALVPALDHRRPDVLVYDLMQYAAGRVAAHRWGLPAVQMFPIFASNAQVNPVQLFAEAAEGTTAGYDAAAPAGDIMGLIRDGVTALGGADVPAWQLLARIEPLNLAFFPKDFQIGHETFDDRYAFVGPCHRVRPAETGAWSPPADPAGPIVLISLGTTYDRHPDFFRACVEAFRDAPLHVVMTVGRLDRAELGPLPPNVEVHPWIAHPDVLAHAGVFLFQGGMTSIMESLAAGVPMVMVPHAGEARINVRRAVELGLGRRLDPGEVTAAALRDTVTEVAGDAAMRRAVAAMGAKVRSAGGAARAADELERFLDKS
ncbi:macrolide family glycosyltransferase [Actinoplanes sp. NPDC048796]|uniref:macrolide family glycosyltransferase n=1 Tax=unclassified Actinoplanes TaxID=2626549 RepID=UPI0033FF6146